MTSPPAFLCPACLPARRVDVDADSRCAAPGRARAQHHRRRQHHQQDTGERQRQRPGAGARRPSSTCPSTRDNASRTVGPGWSGGDRTRLKTSLSAHHHRSPRAAAPSPAASARRTGTHCAPPARPHPPPGQARPEAVCRPPLLLPPPSPPAPPRPAAPSRRRLVSGLTASVPPRSHPLSCSSSRPGGARAQPGCFRASAHTPPPPNFGLHTPCYLVLHTPPSSLSLHHTLRRLAHARRRFASLSTDLLACFDCETLLAAAPPSASIATHPRHRLQISLPRDCTFTSRRPCITLRRFTRQHHQLRARVTLNQSLRLDDRPQHPYALHVSARPLIRNMRLPRACVIAPESATIVLTGAHIQVSNDFFRFTFTTRPTQK